MTRMKIFRWSFATRRNPCSAHVLPPPPLLLLHACPQHQHLSITARCPRRRHLRSHLLPAPRPLLPGRTARRPLPKLTPKMAQWTARITRTWAESDGWSPTHASALESTPFRLLSILFARRSRLTLTTRSCPNSPFCASPALTSNPCPRCAVIPSKAVSASASTSARKLCRWNVALDHEERVDLVAKTNSKSSLNLIIYSIPANVAKLLHHSHDYLVPES